ncbi:MAG: cytochrome c4 [Gemmatimonadota bacterium]
MWRTNVAIVLTVVGTLAVYTTVANIIPQLESEVPTELVLGADVTAEELAAAGEEIYLGAGGCTTCHGLGTRAPDLLGVVGSNCATRRSDFACKEYLYQSLVEPTAFLVEGFQPIMPDMRRTLSNEQIWAVVAFLESQGGTVTVTADDIAATAGEEGAPASGGVAAAAPQGGAGTPPAATDPGELIEASGCLACHLLDGAGGALGPPFDGMGARLAPDYIRRSILFPNADTAQGFEQFAGTMPPTFGQQLTAAQLEAIVQFLSERK